MLGKTHALGGLVAWEAVALHVPGPLWVKVGASLAAIWGAYGPDMDHAKATWARSYWGGPTVARVTARLVGGHRMGTHSLVSVMYAGLAVWGLFAVAALAGPIPAETRAILTLAFMTGWASHLALDGLTIMGIGAFYPYSTRKFHWGALRTSKSARSLNRGEARVTMLLWLVALLLFAQMIIGEFIAQA